MEYVGCSTANNNTTSKKKCAAFSTTYWGLNQHCVENLSRWLVVSVHNATESATVGKWNGDRSRFCEGVQSADGGQSGCLECHMVLQWSIHALKTVTFIRKLINFGTQRKLCLPLPTQGIQRVTVRRPLSSVAIFGPVFTDSKVTFDLYLYLMNDEFVPFLTECGIAIHSAWFQQDGARLRITTAVLCFLHDGFRRKQPCQVSILRSLRKDFHGHQPHRTYSLAIIFCGGNWTRNPRPFSELKACIRSQIETSFKETPIKVLNNFILQLHKFLIFEEIL
jgi:hypothetical protein